MSCCNSSWGRSYIFKKNLRVQIQASKNIFFRRKFGKKISVETKLVIAADEEISTFSTKLKSEEGSSQTGLSLPPTLTPVLLGEFKVYQQSQLFLNEIPLKFLSCQVFSPHKKFKTCKIFFKGWEANLESRCISELAELKLGIGSQTEREK